MSKRLIVSLAAGVMLALTACSASSGSITPPIAPAATDSSTAIPTASSTPSSACKAPAANVQRQIKDMQVDETCYTVPWGMWQDTNGKWWLNPEYDVTQLPEGTSHMPVSRTQNGYVVTLDPKDDEERYSRVAKPSYYGQENAHWIPATVVRQSSDS